MRAVTYISNNIWRNLVLKLLLATQSIEARAQQEECRQACTIGLSINEDTKLEKGKEKGKTGGVVGSYKYLMRAAKALVVSEPMATWQNMAEVLVRSFYHVTPGPPSSTATLHQVPPMP